MIKLSVGAIGSGKTAGTVVVIIDYLLSGSWVGTNIRFTEKARKRYPTIDWDRQLHYFTTEDLSTNFWEIAPSASEFAPNLIALDEVTQFLDAYEDGQRLRHFHYFLQQSRKLGLDVILVTQDENLVQRRTRLLAQEIIVHHDGAKFRIPKFGIPLLPPWRWCFMQRTYSRDRKIPLSGIRWISRKSGVFDLYSTTQTYQDFGGKVWERKKNKVTKAQLNLMMACFVLGIVNLLGLAWGVRAFRAGRPASVSSSVVRETVLPDKVPDLTEPNLYTGVVEGFVWSPARKEWAAFKNGRRFLPGEIIDSVWVIDRITEDTLFARSILKDSRYAIFTAISQSEAL